MSGPCCNNVGQVSYKRYIGCMKVKNRHYKPGMNSACSDSDVVHCSVIR